MPVLARLLGAAGLALHSESLNTGEENTRTTQAGDTWDGDPVGKARQSANSGSLADRQRYLLGRLKAAGYSDAQAAGIIGSLMQESQLDPTAVNKKSGNAGLAQWGGARAAQFQQQFGHSLKDSTFGEQVDFMLWELKNTEKRADQRIRMAQTPAQAAEIHAREYERPGADEANIARRQQYAASVAAGIGRGNAAQIAQQTASAPGAAAGTSSVSTSTSSSETNINGPITIQTQATDAAGIARDFGRQMKMNFTLPQANTGLS
ncbi:MAG: phage tail tip lysozyme [Paraburkholderia tropica]|nr:phage tail tip lysozyme [Paraburkholderia tropica]